MKTEKRDFKPGRRPSASAGSGRKVDPDQPLPGNPSPDDPQDAGDLEAAFDGKEHGEGNYQAAKEYDKGVRSFVRSGKIDDAAERAKPRDREEAREMAEAEQQGRNRSRGEDPSTGGKQKP